MPNFSTLACIGLFYLLILPALNSCTLISTEVEPSLPEGKIDGQSTVAYYANQIPIVVNNTSDLCLLCFGRDYPITVERSFDRRLTLIANEAINAPAGTVTHGLQLGVTTFRGRGTYSLDSVTTTYSIGVKGRNLPNQNYTLVAQANNQLIITANDTTQGILRGTFSLTLIDPVSRQTVAITDGRFDVKTK